MARIEQSLSLSLSLSLLLSFSLSLPLSLSLFLSLSLSFFLSLSLSLSLSPFLSFSLFHSLSLSLSFSLQARSLLLSKYLWISVCVLLQIQLQQTATHCNTLQHTAKWWLCNLTELHFVGGGSALFLSKEALQNIGFKRANSFAVHIILTIANISTPRKTLQILQPDNLSFYPTNPTIVIV